MNKNYFILLFLCVFLLACKKFDHEELNIQESCDLCDFAESLNGTYRGSVIRNSIPPFLSGGDTYDSLTITVDHIFPNNDPYSDSLYMYFATSFAWDSLPGLTYDTIQIRTNTGGVYKSTWGEYSILPDSVTIHQEARFYTSMTQYVTFWKTYGTFYKQ